MTIREGCARGLTVLGSPPDDPASSAPLTSSWLAAVDAALAPMVDRFFHGSRTWTTR